MFHPGIAAEVGYDSNVFYEPDTLPIRGAPILRVRAHLDFGTLPPQRLELGESSTADQKIDFRFSTQVEYREYLSSDQAVQDQRSVNLYAGADLGILPKGPFTLRLFDTFVRTVDPRNQEGPQNFTRDYNRGGFLATLRPGTGRLELGLGDSVDFNLWESKDVRFGNTVGDEATAFARFRFLQQTVGSLTVRAGYRTYTRQPQLESAPIRAMVGVSSLITTWFGAAASIGYGNSLALAKGGVSFSSVIANAEARFFLPRGARLTLGYDRDFFDSLFANFYVDDRIFVSFDHPVVYRLTAHLDGGVRFRHYEGLVDPTTVQYASYSSPDRNDIVYDLHAELNVRATNWLSCGVSYNLVADRTDFEFIRASGERVRVDYIKHSVFARVDVAY